MQARLIARGSSDRVAMSKVIVQAQKIVRFELSGLLFP